MKAIKCIIKSIKEEIEGAEEYAKKATEYKDSDRLLADTYAKMAATELDHVNSLHAHAVRLIKEHKATGKETPAAMQAVWDYEHENQVEWVAKIKMLLEMYRSN